MESWHNEIISEYLLLTEEVIRKVPDNQLIAFWSEVAIFCLKGPAFEKNDTWYDADFPYLEIHRTTDIPIEGREKDPDDKTEWCTPGNEKDASC